MKDCTYLKLYKKYVKSSMISFSQHRNIYIICLYTHYYRIDFCDFNDIKTS